MLECPTPAVAALDELKVYVWVKSSRPDIQVAARFKLPRSIDAQNNETATATVKGAAYERPGQWQRLALTDVPKLLAAEARLMRATPGASIDIREAYLDAVVLFVPGDPHTVEVDTDQLEVEGVTITPPAPKRSTENDRTTSDKQSPPRNSAVVQASFDEIDPAADHTSPARLQGSTLLVEGKPFLPRVIEWNGEPMRFLGERGFNTVLLPEPPLQQQVDEARRYGLWLICRPPKPESLDSQGLGAAGDRVLAWLLEDEALETDPSYASRWVGLIRERDPAYGRPILIAPEMNWTAASRAADIIIARHSRVGLLTGPEYEEWYRSRPRLARPGMPLWASLNTQFGEMVQFQANSLIRTSAVAPSVDFDQLESSLQIAGASGARGFIFRSSSPLSEQDPAARTRASVVELLNRRLQLLEPWLAGGKVVSSETSTNGAVTATVMYVDRSRVLIPSERQTAKQNVAPGNAATKDIKFLVPGVSETAQVYYVTPVSMRLLSTSRPAGGTQMTVPSIEDGMIVITEDPKAIQSLRQHVGRHGAQTLRIERDLIVARARTISQTNQRLSQLGFKPLLSADDIKSIDARLTELDAAMNAGQLERAQQLAYNTKADLRKISRDQQQAFTTTIGLQGTALGLTHDRLTELAAFGQSLSNLRGGENLLAGGDFESLGEMTQFGWQHVVHASAGSATHAQLSAEQPQHGTYSLELQAAAERENVLASVAEPLVWIVSPPIQVDAGKLVEISGWVRIDQPFTTPTAGLAVIDTLGGPELSYVVRQTSGWQSFRMIRAVPKTSELRVTLALTGYGTAKVDAMMVRTLDQPIARRLPAVSPK
jgi:hypothetical protein